MEPKDSLVYQTFFPQCAGLVTVDVRGINHSRHGSRNGRPLLAHTGTVNSVTVLPDSTAFVSGSDDRSVRIWDVGTGDEKLPPLLGHEGSVCSVAIAPDGSMIASASEDSTVRLWDPTTGFQAGDSLRGHERGVTSVKFSTDSRWVISGSKDGTLRIWNVETRQPSSFSPLLCHSGVTAVAFTPDNQTIASGVSIGQVSLWKATNGNLLRTWQVKPAEPEREPSWRYDQRILSLEFSHTGTHILSAGHQRADENSSMGHSGAQEFVSGVWDISTRQCTRSLKGNGRADLQQVLTYSPDEQLVACGSAYGIPDACCNVRLWDATTGQVVATASTRGRSVRTITFTPDGQSIVAGCGRQILVWDVEAVRSRFVDESGDAIAALTDNILFGDSDRTNWIVGPSNELLMWVPPEYQRHLQGGAIKLVIGPARVVLSRDLDGLHYGVNWTQCWQKNVTDGAFSDLD